MKWAILALLALGCSAPEDEATCQEPVTAFDQSAMGAACSAHGVLCLWDNSAVRLAANPSCSRTVEVSRALCRQNVELCWFALQHEFGHISLDHRVISPENEDAADCYAATHAAPSQVTAAVCYFGTTTEVGSDATHRTGIDRANWIRDCQ